MKTFFIIISILISIFIAMLLNYRATSKGLGAPGLVDGILSKCPNKPNCVCSVYKDDPDHFIDPVSIPQNNTTDPLPTLINVIKDMGGKVQVETGNYLSATFTSGIFKFVDDLEIMIDPKHNLIHIRSASRVGHSDMGVNRKRVELLKKLTNKTFSSANK